MRSQPPPPASTEELVARIDSVRFTPVRLREGYDMGEVDRFLDELADEVRSGHGVRHLVEPKLFTPVRMREGYDMTEVDLFLDQVANAADRLATASPPSARTESSAPRELSARSERPAPPTTAAASGSLQAAGDPGVIQEQRGLFGKLFGRK